MAISSKRRKTLTLGGALCGTFGKLPEEEMRAIEVHLEEPVPLTAAHPLDNLSTYYASLGCTSIQLHPHGKGLISSHQSCSSYISVSSLQNRPLSDMYHIHYEEPKIPLGDGSSLSIQKGVLASRQFKLIPSDEIKGNSKICIACGTPRDLKSCDGKGCKKSYHISCLDHWLECLSDGIWFCTACMKKRLLFGIHSIADGIESVWNVKEGMQNGKQYHLLRKRLLMLPKEADDFFCLIGANSKCCDVEWLVKWRDVGYEQATRELEKACFFCTRQAGKLRWEYENCYKAAKQASIAIETKVKQKANQKIQRLSDEWPPDFDSDHLFSVNQLDEFWYKSHGAVLADDKVLTDVIPLYSLGSSVISSCDDVEKTQVILSVFVKHLYGTFSVQVDLKKDLDALRKEVEKRMKLFGHYFTYCRNVLEEGCALLSYGITRDCHIHVHHRLRGGGQRYLTLNDFFLKYKDDMLQTVCLPDGTTSVELTLIGCRILSSWIRCFTHSFMSGISWDGDFDLGSFLVVGDRVKILMVPKYGLNSNTKKNDCIQLVGMIRVFFVLNNEYPPYLPHLLNKLENLSGNTLLPEEQLALERHASLILSMNRTSLLYQIKRKSQSWHFLERKRFNSVLNSCVLPQKWLCTVEDLPLFRDIILWADNNNIKYEDSGRGAFVFIRNYGTHALSYSWVVLRVNNQLIDYQWFVCNNGVELMIPKHFDNFVADMIDELIKGKFDILPELINCSALDFPESPLEIQVSCSETDSSSAKRGCKRRCYETVSSSAKRRRSSSSNSKSESSPRISKRKRSTKINSPSRDTKRRRQREDRD